MQTSNLLLEPAGSASRRSCRGNSCVRADVLVSTPPSGATNTQESVGIRCSLAGSRPTRQSGRRSSGAVR